MLTLDTSALVAAAFPSDRYHQAAVDVLQSDRGPLVVPMAILAEAGYMLVARAGASTIHRFLDDLDRGLLSMHCGDEDMGRVKELVARYRDLPLDLADAAVIACAGRFGGRVMTFDRRDFDVVARGEPWLTIVP